MCNIELIKTKKAMKLLKTKNWERSALKIINSHLGKSKVYQTYLKLNPAMADEYIRFIFKNQHAMYISWDQSRKRFVA